MSGRENGRRRSLIGTVVLFGTIGVMAASLAAWKSASLRAADVAAASQPEPVDAIGAAVAREGRYRPTTTSIGTVLALRSIMLRNEVAGTVKDVLLAPGTIVEAGAVLVALDVSVEQADLNAEQAEAELAARTVERLERLRENGAASAEELDQVRAQRLVALARIERTKAIIERKTIRAPFRARVGITDVHPGQYLNEGTELTTLQSVGEGSNVDFALSQDVAAGLRVGQGVQVLGDDGVSIAATIVAVDARVDPATRNALVRARVDAASRLPAPGASVRVVVPAGQAIDAVLVPVSAVRRGPAGDHVFVLSPDDKGGTRSRVRPIRAGPVVGDDVVVLGGLEAGEQIAATGSFKLHEGGLVHVADAPAAEAVR